MTEIQVDQKKLKQAGAINGFLLGIIVLLAGILSIFLLANTSSFAIVVATPVFITFILPVAATVILVLNLRKRGGGYWNLRQATTGIFIMFLVAYIISAAGNYAFSKVLGEDLKVKTKENLIRLSSGFLEKQGVDQDKIDREIKKINEGFAETPSISAAKIIQGFLQAIILLFVIALIFAAIFKKEPPVYVARGEK